MKVEKQDGDGACSVNFSFMFFFAFELWNSNIIVLENLMIQTFTKMSFLNCIIAL